MFSMLCVAIVFVVGYFVFDWSWWLSLLIAVGYLVLDRAREKHPKVNRIADKSYRIIFLVGAPFLIVAGNYHLADGNLLRGILVTLFAMTLAVYGSYQVWVKPKNRSRWWLIFPAILPPLGYIPLAILKKRKPEPLNTPYRLEQIPDKKQEEETDKNLEVIKPQYKNSSPETMSMDELDHELEESNRKIEQFFILHPRVLEDMPDSDLLTLKKNHNSNQKFVKLIDDILEARAKAKKEF